MQTEWQSPPPQLELEDETVHVWRLRLGEAHLDAAQFRPLLDPVECARADRYRFDADRNRFTTARGVLRKLLARYTNLDERELGFTTSRHGKPAIDPNVSGIPIEFNVSHSGALALIAFTARHAVGVDVEEIGRRVSDEKIAERFFSPDEVARLRDLPEADRRVAFFRCWTRKEAFIKAHGDGLSLPLDSFSVTLDGDDSPRLLRFDGEPGIGHWRLAAPDPGVGYAAAVCVASPKATFQYFAYAADAR